MSVFIYQRKMFQGHILWEKSGNKKYHSYVAWRLKGPLDNVKNNQNQNLLVYVTVMILKRILCFFKGSSSWFFSAWLACSGGFTSDDQVPLLLHVQSVYFGGSSDKLCYMLTALPSSRIQKIMSSFILHGKAISERKLNNNNSPKMLLVFALLSPLYEAFSSAMVQYHHQNQPI